jgi:pilus assembly protein CpaE
VRKGAVIAVVGAGGGVGATTVSLGLAAFLAREGPQSGSETGAAVLDLDLQFGDTDVALNLEPRSTLFEVIDAEARFDDRFLQSVMLDVGRGLKLLAPSPSVMPLETLRPPLAAAIVEAASHLAPFVVVDLPSAWTDATLTVLRRADLIVLVAAPTVASVRRARRVLTALAAAHVTAQRVCALNRVAGVVEAFERPARVGRALEIKIDASLPLEPGVARAQDRGELMLDAYPRSRFCRELRGLANKVRQQLSAPAKSGRTALLGEAA